MPKLAELVDEYAMDEALEEFKRGELSIAQFGSRFQAVGAPTAVVDRVLQLAQIMSPSRPNDAERTRAEQEPLPVLNCFECPWCHGAVDRYAHVFQCRKCKAIGDLITGIMSQSRPEARS